jgi:hypothetical protein
MKIREARETGGRFAYYTTADIASKILKGRQVWLRNTLAMNDYREFDHGSDCLKAAYNSEPGHALNAVLNSCFSGLADEVRDYFNAWLPSIEYDTYMLCLSNHSSDEDPHGRLSMW